MSSWAAWAALVLWLGASGARAQPGDVERELEGALERIYDDRLDEALQTVREVGLRHPGHPAVALYESLVYFEAFLLEDPPVDHTRRLFDDRAAACLSDAEKLEKTSKEEAQYYEGLSLGFCAREEAAEGRQLRAVRLGRRALARLGKLRADDPFRPQVDLGLGAYYYFGSQAPGFIRRLAAVLLGIYPDRRKGLQLIEGAAGRPGVSRWEARWILALIYGSDAEKRWQDADELLAALMERYPHNPAYRLRRVYVAERLGRFDAAYEWARPDGGWVEGLAPELREPARAWGAARAAECLLLAGRSREAAALLISLSNEKPPPALRGWVASRWKQASGQAPVDRGVHPFPWPRTGLPEAAP